MSKHTHHETNQEQRFKKEQGSKAFHYDPYQSTEETKTQDNSRIVAEYEGDIRLRAYQIHLEKGGSDLDNWLEAERSVKNPK